MRHLITPIIRNEEGQGQMEYALILSFVVIVLIASVTNFSGALNSLTAQIAQAIRF